MAKAKKSAGRPSSFTEDIAKSICDRLAHGQSLREICRDDKMPGLTTVMTWLRKHEEFRAQYTLAREDQADYLFDEIVEIADDGTNDWMLRQHGEGDEAEVPNHEHINRSRLRIDTRKWAASKLSPKKYGERIVNEHTGKDGGPIETADVSDAMRAKAVLALMAKTKAG